MIQAACCKEIAIVLYAHVKRATLCCPLQLSKLHSHSSFSKATITTQFNSYMQKVMRRASIGFWAAYTVVNLDHEFLKFLCQMHISGSFGMKKNSKIGSTKQKLLRFEVENGDCGQLEQCHCRVEQCTFLWRVAMEESSW